MFSIVSFGTFAVGIALGYKLGFFYGFSCGRDDQVVLAKIIENERKQVSDSKGSQIRDPWDPPVTTN